VSTSPVVQIPTTSLDANGVSIVAGPKSLLTQQAGQIFNPTTFAAGVPVYFHPLGGQRFVGLYSQRWYGATSIATDPNYYSAYSVDSNPNWIGFDGTMGSTFQVSGQAGFNPPTNTPGTLTLTAGASRSNTYIYTLNTVVNGSNTTALVQNFHVANVGSVRLIAEETIPNATVGGSTVLFNQGLEFSTPYLYYAGTNSSNQVFLARKNWGAVGQSGPPPTRLTAPKGTSPPGSSWTYQTSTGWSGDNTQAMPLKTVGGIMTSVGPISFGSYRDRTFISTVHVSGSTVTGQVYVSRGLYDTWQPVGSPIALGTIGTTYLGGGVQLQPALQASPTNVIVTSAANVTAIPYVTAVKATVSGNSSIVVTWGLLPVARIA
jgi:hypothetical protein